MFLGKNERFKGATWHSAEGEKERRDRVGLHYLQCQQVVEETPGNADLQRARSRTAFCGPRPSLDRLRCDGLDAIDALLFKEAIQLCQKTSVRPVILPDTFVEFKVTLCVLCDRAGRGHHRSQERQRRNRILSLKCACQGGAIPDSHTEPGTQPSNPFPAIRSKPIPARNG